MVSNDGSKAATTALRRRILAAAVSRILPSGSTPGAAEAGVAQACEQAMMDHHLLPVRPYFESGLDGLQAAARQHYSRDFADCFDEQQDTLLRAIENDGDWMSRLFLQTLIHLTLEGFLGDPIHGGNRDGIGWRFIGIEAAAVRSGFCQRSHPER